MAAISRMQFTRDAAAILLLVSPLDCTAQQTWRMVETTLLIDDQIETSAAFSLQFLRLACIATHLGVHVVQVHYGVFCSLRLLIVIHARRVMSVEWGYIA